MPPATGQRTQDLIFTLFGDYLAARGDDIWIGSLIEILGALGVSEQAVRSTVSRMARKGWLSSTKCGRNSFY
ncbi:MAG: phenylacetic acid degradation operon negative regulatory protein PaaX, partial [Anaerolineales bacterium]